jgi:hypothetical protein
MSRNKNTIGKLSLCQEKASNDMDILLLVIINRVSIGGVRLLLPHLQKESNPSRCTHFSCWRSWKWWSTGGTYIIWHMETLLADGRDRTENRPPPHLLCKWWLELASLGSDVFPGPTHHLTKMREREVKGELCRISGAFHSPKCSRSMIRVLFRSIEFLRNYF